MPTETPEAHTPLANNLFFSFLPDESKPHVTNGNIIVGKTSTFAVTLYNKTRQVAGEEQDIQEAFAGFLATVGLAPNTIVTRSEVRLKAKSLALRVATQMLLQKKLGHQGSLVRVLKTWATNHLVRCAPDRAKSFDKTRDYKRKKWSRWKPWCSIMCLTDKPLPRTKSQTQHIPVVKVAKLKNDWKEQLQKSVKSVIVNNQSKDSILNAVQEVMEAAARGAAQEFVERDMAKRLLSLLNPKSLQAAEGTPEWLARLLVPQAPKDDGSSVSRHPSPFPRAQNKEQRAKEKITRTLGAKVLSTRRSAWAEPFNKKSVSLYQDSLYEFICFVKLGVAINVA